MRPLPLLLLLLISCNHCPNQSPTIQITETQNNLEEEDHFLSPCDVLAIEIVRSSSFYQEYFGNKTGVFVGISNQEAVQAGEDKYYAISVSDNNASYPYELTLDLETLTLNHNRDDKQTPISYDSKLKERFREACLAQQ